MTWQDEMIPLLRGVVGDWTNEYNETDLENILIYAAHLINKEIDFENTYVIGISTGTIVPDPTELSDVNFINLTVLKASILVLRSTAKTLAAQSFSIWDGPARVESGSAYKNMSELLKSMESDYERAKLAFKCGDGMAGVAILSPYTVDENTQFTFG